jgi:DNA-binding MarR family transcriptional regulator
MPLSKREYETLAAFRYTLRRFLAFSDAAAARVGLTQQQYQALLAVRAHAGAVPLSISAVGMVDRLEELGMLKRERSDGDRRKVGLRLTARGAQVFERLAVVHRAELRRVGPGLSRFVSYFARPEAEPRSRAGARAHA